MTREFDQPIGMLLDGLGVTMDLGPNQQIVECLVIAKIANFDSDGTPRLALGSSEGLDWLAELALVEATRFLIQRHLGHTLCEDDGAS